MLSVWKFLRERAWVHFALYLKRLIAACKIKKKKLACSTDFFVKVGWIFLQMSPAWTIPQWPTALWPFGSPLPFVSWFPRQPAHKEWWVVFVNLSSCVYSPFSTIVPLRVNLFSLLGKMSLLIRSISSVTIPSLVLDRKYSIFLVHPVGPSIDFQHERSLFNPNI